MLGVILDHSVSDGNYNRWAAMSTGHLCEIPVFMRMWRTLIAKPFCQLFLEDFSSSALGLGHQAMSFLTSVHLRRGSWTATFWGLFKSCLI